MKQGTMFEATESGFQAVVPCDPKVPPEAARRLSAQCEAILHRLRRGPATNAELAGIALKYTGRLSDLRAAGFTIRCTTVDAKAGVYRYELTGGSSGPSGFSTGCSRAGG
jgi:hypothetical protein